MKKYISIIGFTFLTTTIACGGQDSTSKQAPKQIKYGQSASFELKIRTEGSTDAADCLAREAGIWKVLTSEVNVGTTVDGELKNSLCVLHPGRLKVPDEGGIDTYWIAGPTKDVFLFTKEYDEDPVRHAYTTTEDSIFPGTFSMWLSDQRDRCPIPNDEQDESDCIDWYGQLIVLEQASTSTPASTVSVQVRGRI